MDTFLETSKALDKARDTMKKTKEWKDYSKTSKALDKAWDVYSKARLNLIKTKEYQTLMNLRQSYDKVLQQKGERGL